MVPLLSSLQNTSVRFVLDNSKKQSSKSGQNKYEQNEIEHSCIRRDDLNLFIESGDYHKVSIHSVR